MNGNGELDRQQQGNNYSLIFLRFRQILSRHEVIETRLLYNSEIFDVLAISIPR